MIEPASPPLFGSEDDVEPERILQLESDRKLLNNMKILLSGVPPPPSMTVCMLSALDLYDKYNEKEDMLDLSNLERVRSSRKEDTPVYLLNISEDSEDIASLSQRIQSRFIQCETMSSCNIWLQALINKTNAAKKLKEAKKSIGFSPGRRLSHLARRRQIFSYNNIINFSTQPTNNKEKKRLIEIKKTQKQLQADKLNTSKRALFLSPNTTATAKRVTSSEKKKQIKRKLFQSSEKTKKFSSKDNSGSKVSNWLTQNTFSNQNSSKKRKLEHSPSAIFSRKNKCPRRSLTFNEDDVSQSSIKSSEASVETKNENKKPTVTKKEDISEIHKKKLLWAVCDTLKTNKIARTDEIYKKCFKDMFLLCKENLKNILKSQPGTGTTDKMLSFAQSHVKNILLRYNYKLISPLKSNSSNIMHIERSNVENSNSIVLKNNRVYDRSIISKDEYRLCSVTPIKKVQRHLKRPKTCTKHKTPNRLKCCGIRRSKSVEFINTLTENNFFRTLENFLKGDDNYFFDESKDIEPSSVENDQEKVSSRSLLPFLSKNINLDNVEKSSETSSVISDQDQIFRNKLQTVGFIKNDNSDQMVEYEPLVREAIESQRFENDLSEENHEMSSDKVELVENQVLDDSSLKEDLNYLPSENIYEVNTGRGEVAETVEKMFENQLLNNCSLKDDSNQDIARTEGFVENQLEVQPNNTRKMKNINDDTIPMKIEASLENHSLKTESLDGYIEENVERNCEISIEASVENHSSKTESIDGCVEENIKRNCEISVENHSLKTESINGSIEENVERNCEISIEASIENHSLKTESIDGCFEENIKKNCEISVENHSLKSESIDGSIKENVERNSEISVENHSVKTENIDGCIEENVERNCEMSIEASVKNHSLKTESIDGCIEENVERNCQMSIEASVEHLSLQEVSKSTNVEMKNDTIEELGECILTEKLEIVKSPESQGSNSSDRPFSGFKSEDSQDSEMDFMLSVLKNMCETYAQRINEEYTRNMYDERTNVLTENTYKPSEIVPSPDSSTSSDVDAGFSFVKNVNVGENTVTKSLVVEVSDGKIIQKDSNMRLFGEEIEEQIETSANDNQEQNMYEKQNCNSESKIFAKSLSEAIKNIKRPVRKRKKKRIVLKKHKPNWKVVQKDSTEDVDENLKLKFRLSNEWQVVENHFETSNETSINRNSINSTPDFHDSNQKMSLQYTNENLKNVQDKIDSKVFNLEPSESIIHTTFNDSVTSPILNIVSQEISKVPVNDETKIELSSPEKSVPDISPDTDNTQDDKAFQTPKRITRNPLHQTISPSPIYGAIKRKRKEFCIVSSTPQEYVPFMKRSPTKQCKTENGVPKNLEDASVSVPQNLVAAKKQMASNSNISNSQNLESSQYASEDEISLYGLANKIGNTTSDVIDNVKGCVVKNESYFSTDDEIPLKKFIEPVEKIKEVSPKPPNELVSDKTNIDVENGIASTINNELSFEDVKRIIGDSEKSTNTSDSDSYTSEDELPLSALTTPVKSTVEQNTPYKTGVTNALLQSAIKRARYCHNSSPMKAETNIKPSSSLKVYNLPDLFIPLTKCDQKRSECTRNKAVKKLTVSSSYTTDDELPLSALTTPIKPISVVQNTPCKTGLTNAQIQSAVKRANNCEDDPMKTKVKHSQKHTKSFKNEILKSTLTPKCDKELSVDTVKKPADSTSSSYTTDDDLPLSILTTPIKPEFNVQSTPFKGSINVHAGKMYNSIGTELGETLQINSVIKTEEAVDFVETATDCFQAKPSNSNSYATEDDPLSALVTPAKQSEVHSSPCKLDLKHITKNETSDSDELENTNTTLEMTTTQVEDSQYESESEISLPIFTDSESEEEVERYDKFRRSSPFSVTTPDEHITNGHVDPGKTSENDSTPGKSEPVTSDYTTFFKTMSEKISQSPVRSTVDEDIVKNLIINDNPYISHPNLKNKLELTPKPKQDVENDNAISKTSPDSCTSSREVGTVSVKNKVSLESYKARRKLITSNNVDCEGDTKKIYNITLKHPPKPHKHEASAQNNREVQNDKSTSTEAHEKSNLSRNDNIVYIKLKDKSQKRKRRQRSPRVLRRDQGGSSRTDDSDSSYSSKTPSLRSHEKKPRSDTQNSHNIDKVQNNTETILQEKLRTIMEMQAKKLAAALSDVKNLVEKQLHSKDESGQLGSVKSDSMNKSSDRNKHENVNSQKNSMKRKMSQTVPLFKNEHNQSIGNNYGASDSNRSHGENRQFQPNMEIHTFTRNSSFQQSINNINYTNFSAASNMSQAGDLESQNLWFPPHQPLLSTPELRRQSNQQYTSISAPALYQQYYQPINYQVSHTINPNILSSNQFYSSQNFASGSHYLNLPQGHQNMCQQFFYQ